MSISSGIAGGPVLRKEEVVEQPVDLEQPVAIQEQIGRRPSRGSRGLQVLQRLVEARRHRRRICAGSRRSSTWPSFICRINSRIMRSSAFGVSAR